LRGGFEAIVFLGGAALIVGGIYLWSPPAALVFGGLFLIVVATASARRPKTPE